MSDPTGTAPTAQTHHPSLPDVGCSTARRVVITAAAGTGIGWRPGPTVSRWKARRWSSATLHERRLGEAADALADEFGARPATFICDVTSEDDVQGLVAGSTRHPRRHRRVDEQRRPGRQRTRHRAHRRPVVQGASTSRSPARSAACGPCSPTCTSRARARS